MSTSNSPEDFAPAVVYLRTSTLRSPSAHTIKRCGYHGLQTMRPFSTQELYRRAGLQVVRHATLNAGAMIETRLATLFVSESDNSIVAEADLPDIEAAESRL
jgi:hypothetical protein